MHFIGGFCYCLWVFTLRLEVVTCMAVTESSGFGSCWQPCSDEWIWYVWSPACKCLCLGCIQPGWGVCNEVARHVLAGSRQTCSLPVAKLKVQWASLLLGTDSRVEQRQFVIFSPSAWGVWLLPSKEWHLQEKVVWPVSVSGVLHPSL